MIATILAKFLKKPVKELVFSKVAALQIFFKHIASLVGTPIARAEHLSEWLFAGIKKYKQLSHIHPLNFMKHFSTYCKLYTCFYFQITLK